MKVQRVKTGINNLDELIGGGFKKNSTNLIGGGPGTGKTIFAIQFLVEGLKNGESAIYITFEEKKETLYEDMLEFGWDLEKYEKAGKFVLLEYKPEQVKKILTEGGGVIESTVEQIKAQRLVIDSITSFSLLYKDELSKKESALSLFEMIEGWGCTSLLTAQDEESDDEIISASMEFEVDGIILVYHVKLGGRRKRAIEILKMRGTKTPDKIMALDIGDKGVIIKPNEVVEF
jgi:KaiC/GvpD/RAD55 family RecA-like ATPase